MGRARMRLVVNTVQPTYLLLGLWKLDLVACMVQGNVGLFV